MAKANVSVKFLIHLVGERPALWDKTSEDYKDRALRETSWREICTFVNEDYEHMQAKAKEEFTRMIMRKWTHIRDSWVKSMKYGYDEVTKTPPKPYIYHNDLHFMQKILKCKPPRYNMSQLSNRHFEEFYRIKNDTQNSNGATDDMENNEDEDEVGFDVSPTNMKQEPNVIINEDEHIENKNEDDAGDDWPLEDTVVIEEQVDNKEQLATTRKTRSSIFKNSRGEDEYKKPQEVVRPSPVIVRSKPDVVCPSPLINEKHLVDNRHWNFFKGILPSVNDLDEDHVLQFQSGVIVLLQKLRQSQKQQPKSNRVSSHSLYRGRGRKRKASTDYDEDYNWPIHNVEVTAKYSRRSTRNNTDPIAAEDMQSENNYSSEN